MSVTLLKLAEEGTDSARAALFGELCRLVTDDLDQRTTPELTIFAEVTLKLYSDATADDRVRLAQKLSNCPDIPDTLAKKIAEDDAPIASSLLASSPVFSQEDLLQFIQELSNAHLQAIAHRPDLSSEVSDALAQKGDTPIHRILAGNREIRLSRDAMVCLVRLAAEDSKVRDSLSHRSDLTPAICQQLLPMVNEDAKKRLTSIIQGALSQEQLDQIAKIKNLRRELGHALDNNDMSLLWPDARRAGATPDELVTLLLQDQRFNHVVELMSLRGRIAQKAFKDAVFNGKLQTVMRTAARCGLQPQTFSLFVKARCAHLRIPAKKGSSWIGAYAAHLKELEASKESRCSDFQANRKGRKSEASATVSSRLAFA
ncbi:DUF2336 domain-containing protein [Roseibium alexandrii]|uniref:DUF2336 domain-containing protein n=1 Tax=Roseibium alexandrii TaxID=388408 RepID=A0A0M7ACH6_9HYPH|nr:DUF2336 domain-containing protein [Roseibium alexandrii]CTQ72579.1 hypothetical protein LAX5112_03232 [Roseibium alexandrii]